MSTMILQELPYAKDPVFEPGLWFLALALAGTRAGTYGTPPPARSRPQAELDGPQAPC